jgi:hypothetical protein
MIRIPGLSMDPLRFIMRPVIKILLCDPRHHYELISLFLDLLRPFGVRFNAKLGLLLKFIHEIKLSQYWR